MPRTFSGWLIATLLLLAGYLAPGLQTNCWPEPSVSLSSKSIFPEGGLEDELLALTNQNRVRQGLQELTPDEALRRMAREHSAGMAHQGFISHELPSGDLKSRMSRGGYVYVTVRENVATASSVFYAQDALMESPAHRANILAADVNRAGIGIVRCPPPYEKELYITEIFASPVEEYPAAEARENLRIRIENLGKSEAGPLIPDPLLEKLAGDSVQSLDVPVQREALQNVVVNSAGQLRENGRADISRVDVNVQLLRDLRNLKIVNQGGIGRQARIFGTAIRQVLDSRNEPAYLVLTLIGY